MGLREVSGKTEPTASAHTHLERLVNKVAPKDRDGGSGGMRDGVWPRRGMVSAEGGEAWRMGRGWGSDYPRKLGSD